jgi:hypothetical protein
LEHGIIARLRVPIASESIVAVPALIFGGWRPGDDEPLEASDEEATIRISVPARAGRTVCQNEPVSEFVVELGTTISDGDLRALERASSLDPKSIPPRDLIEVMESLTARLQGIVLGKLNSLVEYARVAKGQYWLQTHSVNSDNASARFQAWSAEFQLNEDGEWRPWPRAYRTGLTGVWHGESARYLSENDWIQMEARLESSVKLPLPLVLLAEAERLASRGESRAALTEAVAALEAALALFARSPVGELSFRETLAKRVPTDRLLTTMKRLGLRTTLAYVLPMLLDEAELPTAMLQVCLEAVDQRGTVVLPGTVFRTISHAAFVSC